MSKNTSLEASHELVTEGLVATLVKATSTTEAEEDTPLFGKISNVYCEYALSPLPRKNTANSAHSLRRLDRKNLTETPLPAKIMHDLRRWSEAEVSITEKGKTSPQRPKNYKKQILHHNKK